jgi:hypothetical protein
MPATVGCQFDLTSGEQDIAEAVVSAVGRRHESSKNGGRDPPSPRLRRAGEPAASSLTGWSGRRSLGSQRHSIAPPCAGSYVVSAAFRQYCLAPGAAGARCTRPPGSARSRPGPSRLSADGRKPLRHTPVSALRFAILRGVFRTAFS